MKKFIILLFIAIIGNNIVYTQEIFLLQSLDFIKAAHPDGGIITYDTLNTTYRAYTFFENKNMLNMCFINDNNECDYQYIIINKKSVNNNVIRKLNKKYSIVKKDSLWCSFYPYSQLNIEHDYDKENDGYIFKCYFIKTRDD